MPSFEKIKKMISLYFDPGTGALVIQFFAAVVAGVLLFYKTVLFKIKSFFGIKTKIEDDFMDESCNKEEKQ